MRKLQFTILFLCLIITTFGQEKKEKFIFNVGCQRTNSIGTPQWGYCGLSYVTKQRSAVFFDVNFLYSRPTKVQGLRLILGSGISQKGMIQQGMESFNEISITVRRTYLDFYGGVAYEQAICSKTKLIIGQLLKPELDVSDRLTSGGYKFFPLASRSFVSFEYKLSEKLGIQLSPYFETALVKYNKSSYGKGTDYRPYGFGVNVGMSF